MAFRDMVGGDCSGSNSMLKFVNHATQDLSAQRENQSMQAGPSARPQDQFVREFFSNERQQRVPPGFQMKELGNEFENLDLNSMRGGGAPGFQNWAEEFHHAHPPSEQELFENIYRQHSSAGHAWQNEYLAANPQFQAQFDPGQFEHFEKLYQSVSTQSNKITELQDDWKEEFLEQTGKGKEKAWEEEFQQQEGFEEIWKNIKQSNGALHFDDEEEIWDNSMVNPFENQQAIPNEPYLFEADNPFLTHPSPLEEGLQLMETGNLSDAVLAFEAAVQKDSQSVEGWFRLGTVQQENEKELPAISALRMAVALDPKHMGASLALAVSYTNEGAESQALDSLENWIRTKYGHLDFPPLKQGEMRQDYVANLYLQAVRSSHEIDADVQVGLGVLFNISCDYNKAVDCFEAALQVKPEDYIIWNRLGASLANGGRSEEAIDAYHKALHIKPSFVRARYNLGVSCINIGCYKEAAEHFLGALALHGNAGNQRNISKNLWDTLRRTFLMMDRRDLHEKATHSDLEAFRGEFEF